jgi:phage baseplate assembly protein gpV
MTERLLNLVRREVERALARRARRVPGIVDSYDPDRHAVKVKLQPEGVLTGWLDIETLQIGDQCGVLIAPNIGDTGWVEFHEDDFNAGIFVGGSFNDRFKPAAIAAGEMLLKHKSGSSLYFKEDGTVTVTDQAGSKVVLDGQGTANVFAETVNLGPEGSDFLKLVTDAFEAVFNSHTHPGNNQPPNVLTRMSDAQLTSKVNAA